MKTQAELKEELISKMRDFETNMTEEQLDFIEKELDFDIREDETIRIMSTCQFNDKQEIIYKAVLTNADGNERHICYV